MTPPNLLAKSRSVGRKDKSLVEHTVDVVTASQRMFGSAAESSRLGRCWLRFFRLPEIEWLRFHSALLAACLFHDWGKANADMQNFFHGSRSGGQQFEHEHLSLLMLGSEGVDRWVRQRSDVDWDVVLAAVGSHHLRFTHELFAVEVGANHAVRVFADHNDLRIGLVGEVRTRLGLTGDPVLPPQPYWGYTNDPATFNVEKLRKTIQSRLNRINSTPMLLAVRSALIAADAVGSALPRTGADIGGWVAERMDPSAVCDPAQIEGVIARRIAAISPAGRWKWNEFQDVSETLPDRALILAPCGAGKTLAAWRWILGRVKDRPVKRVLFLYPTRATATEGFKDYVSWAPEADAALLHGTADYDLDGMFSVTDPRAGKAFADIDPRLFALRHWSKRIFSATVDQFFAFMSYGYGPMCLLPLLADSVIVVDEVHSFDKKMFSALLGFLKAFDVPVLCMTATMQAGRKDQLGKLVETVYGYDEQPADLTELAGTPRYRVKRIVAGDVQEHIREAVAAGKRVLWVVNQVSRAQEGTATLGGLHVPVICYHSRFKLDDRVERHRETVAAIRAGQPAAVVVSTQVCEMSLDIDADVFITEECPITSLIQRMGRCRRGRDELATKGPGEVFVYKPAGKEMVYGKDDLTGLDAFVRDLETLAAASQTDLETGLEKHGPKGADAPKLNSFLTSGAYADAGDDTYRDIEAFNVQAVLAGDVAAYVAAKKAEQPGFILPVPKKLKPQPDPRLPKWLCVADDRHYDPKTGFHDQPLR